MKVLELYQALNISEEEYSQVLKTLKRKPNELETYLFSAMWSEHCGYKHSKKYLKLLPRKGSVCCEENAGGIQIGEHIVFFKAESHNHPCAVEPFQGAATGIGGIIRDVLALGARPIALLDSLKFGSIKNAHVKHLFDGVVRGISAYGNSIGVPTVAGEVSFDESYTESPLVNVMAVGIVRKDQIKKSIAVSGNAIILMGSDTGRDGIHGASFASKELSDKSKEDRPSVQVGDPFMKKVLIEATLETLKLDEVLACQDCGAAGLLSSSCEMAYKGECGMELYLDKVHLREPMLPWEIMLSESQERMLFVVDEKHADKVLKIAQKYDIPANIIGKTVKEKAYKLFWNGKEIANVPPSALCDAPEYELTDEEPQYIKDLKKLNAPKIDVSVEQAVERMVSDPNFASKKWVFRQYDHTVGNRTSIKPGISGGAGIWLYEEGGVLGLTIDANGRQVYIDPYAGGENTVWESYRNLVSGGFEPMGITDCLNFGNPEKDEVAYSFVEAIKGLSNACEKANIPVVSGNVSFYNESPAYRVFPTPTVGMAGYVNSPDKLINNAFLKGETIILLGKEITDKSDIGGSLYLRTLKDFLGGKVDRANAESEIKMKNAVFKLRDKSLLGGCVDVSEGGLFCALLEGLEKGSTGFKGNLIACEDKLKALFGEIQGRYVISVKNAEDVKKVFKDLQIPHKILGICEGETIEFNGYKFNSSELFKLYNSSIELEMQT